MQVNLEYKQEKKIIFKLHLHSIWSFRHPAKPLFMGFSAIFQATRTWKMNIFRFLPLPFLAIMLAVTFGNSFGDKFMYQHAMKAPDEMRELHKQFYAYMKKMKKCGCKAKKVQ